MPQAQGFGKWWHGWREHRWLQGLLMLGMAGMLAYDRYLICTRYLFKYTDEDQTCNWYAAHDLLNGHIGEPGFYGQDYSTCLEGFLAAPLVACHVPYAVACPLVAVLLGLFPFLLLALVAWRRGQSLAAAGALLVPLILPIRYSIICGIPRGFVTGLALAIVPAVLLLPPPERGRGHGTEDAGIKSLKKPRWLSRAWPALRYFLAAALSVVACQVNPGCVLLLVPVAVYAAMTTWRQWKFWVFSIAGIVAAVPYPLYVYQFYYLYHQDYVLHMRGVTFPWGYDVFTRFLRFAAPDSRPSPVFADLAPIFVSGNQASLFLIAAFGAVTALLVLRLRAAAVGAAFAGAMITLVSFSYQRVMVGGNTASYAYSRLFLAIPVIFVWLLLLVNHKPWGWVAKWRVAPWITRCVLAGLVVVGYLACRSKERQLPDAIYAEVNATGSVVCPAVSVDYLAYTAREIQRVAQAEHADLVIINGDDRMKDVAYALPALTGIETLFPQYERRTWRLIEEYTARRDRILLVGVNVPGATRVGGGMMVNLDGQGNIVPASAATTAAVGGRGGQSVRVPYISVTSAGGESIYTLPALRRLLPQVTVPQATPELPHPGPQVMRRNGY